MAHATGSHFLANEQNVNLGAVLGVSSDDDCGRESRRDGEVTLIHIGDLHGHLVPRHDQRVGSPTRGLMVGGLAYVYGRISKIRAAHPQHLLINTGDTIQGSAEALFARGDALIDILNN